MLLKLKFSFTFGSIITLRRKRSQEPIIRRNGPARSEWRCRHRLDLEVPPKRIPCPPTRLTSAQQIKIEEASKRLRKRKALSRLRACSLLGEPLSERIGRQWRFSNARSTRALARYGCSAHGRDVYPSHLAASFSTVPSSWSFLMASLMALVSSGLSLFTATAYSSPVATSRTTWASL